MPSSAFGRAFLFLYEVCQRRPGYVSISLLSPHTPNLDPWCDAHTRASRCRWHSSSSLSHRTPSHAPSSTSPR